jgi:hypothetical protein
VTSTCSDGTRTIAEPLAGSAGVVTAFVAISWPKPLWDPDEAFRSEGLPPELEGLVLREQASGHRLSVRAFQRSAGSPSDGVELIGLRPRDGGTLHLRELPLDGIVARATSFCRGEETESPLRAPVTFVCTDGRHDRCCAKYGAGVYQAIRTEAERRGLTLDVVESSHLGGHRFAATCLFLPSGEMYGRLRPSDAPELLDAWAHDRVCVRRFRGRIGESEPVQAAEAYLRARYPDVGSLNLEESGAVDGVTRVRGRVRHGERSSDVVLECRIRRFEGPSSCSAPEPESRERWIVSALLPT